MTKQPILSEKFMQLKSSIHNWFKKTTEDSTSDADRAHRNAEELIWTFQERFGYSGIREDRDQ